MVTHNLTNVTSQDAVSFYKRNQEVQSVFNDVGHIEYRTLSDIINIGFDFVPELAELEYQGTVTPEEYIKFDGQPFQSPDGFWWKREFTPSFKLGPLFRLNGSYRQRVIEPYESVLFNCFAFYNDITNKLILHPISSYVIAAVMMRTPQQVKEDFGFTDAEFAKLEIGMRKKKQHHLLEYSVSKHYFNQNAGNSGVPSKSNVDQEYYIFPQDTSGMHVFARIGNAFRRRFQSRRVKKIISQYTGLDINTINLQTEVSLNDLLRFASGNDVEFRDIPNLVRDLLTILSSNGGGLNLRNEINPIFYTQTIKQPIEIINNDLVIPSNHRTKCTCMLNTIDGIKEEYHDLIINCHHIIYEQFSLKYPNFGDDEVIVERRGEELENGLENIVLPWEKVILLQDDLSRLVGKSMLMMMYCESSESNLPQQDSIRRSEVDAFGNSYWRYLLSDELLPYFNHVNPHIAKMQTAMRYGFSCSVGRDIIFDTSAIQTPLPWFRFDNGENLVVGWPIKVKKKHTPLVN